MKDETSPFSEVCYFGINRFELLPLLIHCVPPVRVSIKFGLSCKVFNVQF